MLHFFFDLWLSSIPEAHAQLQNVGASNPAVANMWAAICDVVPFCGLTKETAPAYFATKVIDIVESLITSVAIIMIIYASILLSTVSMDESRKDEAKKIIIYALAGIVLTLISGTLIDYMLTEVFPDLFNT
jgi:hypothetical protein